MMEPTAFLDGRIKLCGGDCLEVVRLLPDNSIDAVCTDPPYALGSIVKRFGATGIGDETDTAARSRSGADGYARLAKGFMGKAWDTGDVAFAVEFWSEIIRVLKPGAHIVAFGGTRTYHRLACAIEDAGFEIRDQLGWCFGVGFPKSHDVSKGIDKQAGAARDQVKPRSVIAHQRSIGNTRPWMDDPEHMTDSDEPAAEAASAWDGWGTALKPAWEPICLARKPLSEGTVAANVLRWGTGALNIDACRVNTADNLNGGAYSGDFRQRGEYTSTDNVNGAVPLSRLNRGAGEFAPPVGRWPANIIHDGSEEVIAAFPDSDGAQGVVGGREPSETGDNGIYGRFARVASAPMRDDSGSAARFFYSAKADSDDRLGSKHPTVKPVDLMQWLCRLVTPPNGVVLDPFSGTGTTGEAAWREGFSAILIEREAEYLADIARRMSLCGSSARERKHESIKARGKAESAGPLFDGQPA